MLEELKDHFIPHGGNDYTPHILQRVALVVMAIMIIFTFAVANFHSLLWTASEWLVSTVLPSVIVELTNEERAVQGATQLQRNVLLDQAAQLKAQHMAANQYFAHYSPDGVSPWFWFNQASYEFAHAGENLAIHFTDSGEVVEAWMQSPSHRANIVDQKFTEIGVGTARGQYQGYDTVYVVQLFGTPAAPSAVSTVTLEQVTETAEADPVVLAESFETLSEMPVETSTATPTSTIALAPMPESADLEPVTSPEERQELDVQSVVDLATTEPETSEMLESTELNTEVAVPAESETPVVVADVAVEDDRVSVYSDIVATSSGRAVAPPTSENAVTDTVSTVGRLATQPSALLQLMYLVLGVFVILSLLVSIFVEMQHQRPVQVAYGVAMLFLMSGLFYLHTYVTSGALIV